VSPWMILASRGGSYPVRPTPRSTDARVSRLDIQRQGKNHNGQGSGAIVFYTGNLLWIESRRKKQRDANLPEQKRSTRVLGSLTIGVSLGCVIGISATLAATKWLPGLVANVPAWHEGIYYAAFLLAVAWAFLRGAARSAYELLYVGAVVTALIPVGSLAALAGVPGTWNHSSAGVAVDATAIVAAAIFWQLARQSRKRAKVGHKDSVWAIEGNSP
jgi:hypothetical protein